MRDRMFLNKLHRLMASQGDYQGPVPPSGITDMAGGGGGGPVAPNAITDIGGREDMTVTPGAITDRAGGGGGPVAPSSITDIAGATAPNRITDGGTDQAVGDTQRDTL